jgi:hypothetical protein
MATCGHYTTGPHWTGPNTYSPVGAYCPNAARWLGRERRGTSIGAAAYRCDEHKSDLDPRTVMPLPEVPS